MSWLVGAYRCLVRGSPSRALWRVRPYLRPYVRQLATMVVASLAGIGAALAVPLVIRGIVDGPIARGDRGAVAPLALLVLLLGMVETGLAFMRRWVQARAANGFATTSTPTSSRCPPPSTTAGTRGSCSAGPWPTCRSSGGSWASAWCS
jgi:hypothetical protein